MGFQPNTVSAFCASATRLGGSPARGPSIRDRDRAPRDFASAFDHFHHRISVARPEIEEIGLPAFAKMLESPDVRIGQIGHVHVVADCGSIGSRIARPEHGHLRLLPRSRFQNVRHKMRFRLVVFAATLRGTRRVEVAQRDELQAVGAVDSWPAAAPSKASTSRKDLPATCGLDSGIGTCFGSPYVAARRRKYNAPNSRRDQRAHQRDALLDVVLEILCRVRDRLTHVRERGEMDARLDLVFRRRCARRARGRRLARDRTAHLDSRRPMPAHKVVEHYHVLALGPQAIDGHAPDVAGPACHQNCHRSPIRPVGLALTGAARDYSRM